MASEVAHTVTGRFVAKIPGSRGVIAISETAAEAEIRAAVAALGRKRFGPMA